MKIWKIGINFSDGTNDQLDLYDCASIFNEYITIKRKYFNELIKQIKDNPKYITGKAINKVSGPDGSDWTNNPWLFLLIKELENQKPIWLLFKREKNLDGLLVAIGPKQFANYLNSRKESDKTIKKLLNYFIAYPSKWANLVLLPNFL